MTVRSHLPRRWVYDDRQALSARSRTLARILAVRTVVEFTAGPSTFSAKGTSAKWLE
jgi:hypothetical protein